MPEIEVIEDTKVEMSVDEKVTESELEDVVEDVVEEEKKQLTADERKRMKRKAYKQKQKAKRQAEKAVSLTPEQIEAQQNLKNWENMCNMIKDYKDRFNKFPNMRNNGREVNDEAAKVLGRWLWLQNAAYKKGTMNPYHVRRLEEIGWKFKK